MDKRNDLSEIFKFLKSLNYMTQEYEDEQQYSSENDFVFPTYLLSFTSKELIAALIISLCMSDTISIQDFIEAIEFVKQSKFE